MGTKHSETSGRFKEAEFHRPATNSKKGRSRHEPKGT